VVGDDNIVQERQVETATRISDLWLITSGLTADDKIVIDGLQKVATGMSITPVISEFKSQTEEQG
jgi:membrane fusion protein (multidrug efflux system)